MSAKQLRHGRSASMAPPTSALPWEDEPEVREAAAPGQHSRNPGTGFGGTPAWILTAGDGGASGAARGTAGSPPPPPGPARMRWPATCSIRVRFQVGIRVRSRSRVRVIRCSSPVWRSHRRADAGRSRTVAPLFCWQKDSTVREAPLTQHELHHVQKVLSSGHFVNASQATDADAQLPPATPWLRCKRGGCSAAGVPQSGNSAQSIKSSLQM